MSFNLYFNKHTGDLKAVSPVDLPDFHLDEMILIEDEIAFKFLTCEYQMHQWFVIWNGSEYKLVQNTLDLLPSDYGKMIRIEEDESLNDDPFPGVTIDVFKKTNVVTVSIPQRFVGKRLSNINQKKTKVMVTAKNDPVAVIDEFEIDIGELQERGVVSYSVKTVEADFHTKKVFPKYRIVRHESDWKKTVNSGYKINKMSMFRKGGVGDLTAVLRDDELILTLVKGSIIFPNTSGIVIVTAPNDATIMIEPLKYDFNELLTAGEVRIPFTCSDQQVGLAGFPITEKMVFRDERTIQNQRV